jgi:hypothetical protein
MKSKLSQIFKNLPEIQPQASLEVLIMQKIGLQRAQIIRKKRFVSFCGLIFSTLALGETFFLFGKAFWQAEFWSLATLLFSDLLTVATNWKDFSYSLLETFPVISAIALLIPVFLLLLSLDAYLASRKNNFKLHFN